MKEITLRKTHRTLGLTLALFIFLQGGSGLLLTAGELLKAGSGTTAGESHGHAEGNHPVVSAPADFDRQGPDLRDERHGLVGRLHHGEGVLWNLYRLVVGFGLLGMLASGVAIFLKSRARNVNNSPA